VNLVFLIIKKNISFYGHSGGRMKNSWFKYILINLLLISNAVAVFDLEKIKNRYRSALTKDFLLIPHNGTYLFPVSYNGSPNKTPYDDFTSLPQFSQRGEYNKKLEAEFQISFLVLGARNLFFHDLNFFIGYTQQSWWQIYNEDWSRPFRETNYAPEAFFRKSFLEKEYNFMGAKVPVFDFGYIHQSNGQLQELSRSWDRLFVRTVLDLGPIIISPMLWLRVPENKNDDDNSDIQDYLGIGNFKFIKSLQGKKQISLKVSPGFKRVGFELDYSQPWTKGYRFYTKVSTGTGLSLLDYDHTGHKVGIGFILNDIITSQD
jgi:phospholipase A1